MAQQQIQQEAERMASLHELGALQREYRIPVGYLLPGLALFYLIPSFLVVVLLITFIQMDGLWIAVPIALIASLCAHRLVIWFWSIHQNRHSRTFLYTHGLLALRCQGKRMMASEAIHWRDIAVLWHDVKRGKKGGSFHSYRLQRSDKAFFGQDVDKGRDQALSLGRIEQNLGKHVERMVLPYLWPLALSAYEQGLPIEFGPLTLYINGIQSPASFLPWSWFERFGEDNAEGRLFIIPKPGRFSGLRRVWACVASGQGEEAASLQPIHPWAAVPYAQVPNLALFLRLIEFITDNPPPSDNLYLPQKQAEGLG